VNIQEEMDMKSFFNEFKKFIMRGNVMDMAVGVIIGAAFKAIVDSLVNDIISPIIGGVVNVNFSELVWSNGGITIAYGSFVMAIINFVIIGFVLFCIIKIINRAENNISGPKKIAAPTTKKCPYCKSEIPIDATRCPNCTSELDIEK